MNIPRPLSALLNMAILFSVTHFFLNGPAWACFIGAAVFAQLCEMDSEDA